MKLDKICRTCLLEKAVLKPLFGACVANMLMSCASIQIMEGDGLPCQICIQCLQMVNRAYSFKQQCEKSDASLRHYINSLQTVSLQVESEMIINEVKADQLFSSNEVLQQTSLFQDIFNDATSHSLVDNFTNQNASTVVSDLAETMQSLQTIAEQCLPESWETDTQIMSCHSNSQETNCSTFDLTSLYRCQFCEDIFKDEWTLGEHMKIHTGQNKHFCSICGKACATPSLLNKHTMEHSIPNKNNLIETKKFCNQNFMCSICDRTFIEERFLKKHLKEIHFSNVEVLNDLDKKHVCTICDKRYKQNKLLVMHMRTHTGVKPHRCEVCGKSFTFPSSLHKHRNIHLSEKKCCCTICGRKFNQSSNLTAHLRTHTGEKPYVCNLCGKACVSSINLNVHMRIHTGEKPYKCLQCNSAFASSTQLKKHTTKHTGERPYQCWQCGKSFRQKETRDTHVRYHTGERPYVCNLCPKKYIAASHLRVHMKSHTDEKNYHCHICMRKFAEAKVLKSHILTHTGQKPYTCEFCNSRFSQSGSLNNHIKNQHKFS